MAQQLESDEVKFEAPAKKVEICRADYVKALEVFIVDNPEYKDILTKYADALIDSILKNAENPLKDVEEPKFVQIKEMEIQIKQIEWTDCDWKLASVVVDCFSLLIGLWGLHVLNRENVTRYFLRALGQDTLRGLARIVNDIRNASTGAARALAVWTLLSTIFSKLGIKAVIQEAFVGLPWYEWVKTGVIMIAQITAWVATAGVAFIAEIALSVMDAAQLTQDLANYFNSGCYEQHTKSTNAELTNDTQ